VNIYILYIFIINKL